MPFMFSNVLCTKCFKTLTNNCLCKLRYNRYHGYVIGSLTLISKHIINVEMVRKTRHRKVNRICVMYIGLDYKM